MASRWSILTMFVLLLMGSLAGCSANSNGGGDRVMVVIAGETFNLELALDNDARYKGLSGRKEIATDGGMLFVFPAADPLYFVMRDCFVPIDILFLDPNGRVVNTHRMTIEPPGTPNDKLPLYPSAWPSQFAIELKGGTLDRLKIKEGDKVEMPIDELKRRAR